MGKGGRGRRAEEGNVKEVNASVEEIEKRRLNRSLETQPRCWIALLQRGKHVGTWLRCCTLRTDWLVGSVTRYRDSDKKDGTTNQLFPGPFVCSSGATQAPARNRPN